jgi:hypothetical protein
MKNEKMYHAITNIRENLIEEAEHHRFRSQKRTVKRFLTIAASLVFVVGLAYFGGLMLIFGPASSGGVAYNDRQYMAYEGPVFPLTALENDGSLTAKRHLTYDFTAIVDEYSFPDALILDAYTLTNTANEDKTYRLVYPFVASVNTSKEYIPSILEYNIQTELHIGRYAGGYEGVWGAYDPEGTVNLDHISSWTEYKALLSDGTYMQDAFKEFPEMNQPVVIYKISNMQAHGEGTSPTLKFSCEHDPTAVTSFALGTRGGSYDTEKGKFSYHFSLDADEVGCVFVIGGDLATYSTQGYEDGGCDKGEEIDITATITREEGVLGEVLFDLLFDEWDGTFSSDVAFGVFAEIMYTNGFLAENPAERYRIDLSSLLSDARNVDRVMYLTFELAVPAGESKDITLLMQKAPSMDFAGKYKTRYGFDMVTRLGTNIMFNEQKAKIVLDTEKYEFADQNFGFDLETGIFEVTLSLDTEHYYMDIRKKPEE